MHPEFFHYFPPSPSERLWGISATSFGNVRVHPNASYPPEGHPENHHFDWSRGRTLNDYQLLYIHEGKGIFESSLTKPKKLQRGTAFILFPGVWHRYRPDRSTGWRESWIELNGTYLEHLRSVGRLDPKKPVYWSQNIDDVESLWHSAQRLVRSKPPGFSIRLGLLALQILICLRSNSTRGKSVPRRIEHLISKSQALMAGNLLEGDSIEKIARELGVGYSYFRREFRNQTGFSPKQYQNEIRHRRAKDLLLSTRLTVKEISEQLGYYSPYHLSFDFSKRMGLSPARWRSSYRSTSKH